MFKSIPDEVDINMKLRTDLSEIHIININETYEIETDYDVYVPLVFEELHINYEEIIEDLQKDLGDISEYVTDMNVSVEMTIQNNIPCELTLKSEEQDINGKKLNIEVKFWDKDKSDTEAIIPADGSKDLVLKLVAKDGELEYLDKIILTINGNIAKSQTGKALNAEQFIKMDKMVLVVDGIEMNFND